jgi:PAS domain S-box-containing protein
VGFLFSSEALLFLSSSDRGDLMKKKTKTKQELPLQMEEFQSRLHVAEQRLEEANKLMQAEITERKRAEETLVQAQKHFESIVETIREPLLVLTADLHVISANHSFYQTFQVTSEETEGRFIYSIGNHQWDIPALRTLLEEIIPKNSHFNDFEVDHEFPTIGPKKMLLNARRIYHESTGTDMILLAIEDITQRRQAEEALNTSETRYRRLFETAQDGILILDADTGRIVDVNPFLLEMLRFTHDYCFGKKLWEIGAFQDVEASKSAFSELQRKGYVRYEDLPLETRDGRHIDVEFVSNVYLVNGKKVIQCNIRDITAHKHAEELVIKSLDQVQQIKLEWESTVDSLLQLIFVLDEQGHILRANRTVEAWNLGKVGVVHGMEMHALLHPGCTDQGCYLETLWPQARGKLDQGQSVDRELEDTILCRHLSIQIRPIVARKNGLRIKAQSFAVGIFWDITRRKRIEGEREKLIHELQEALTNIKRLRGLLPMCASCKKIRDDKGYWNDVEAYISEHSEAEFTHGFCPDCMKKLYGISLDKDGNFQME